MKQFKQYVENCLSDLRQQNASPEEKMKSFDFSFQEHPEYVADGYALLQYALEKKADQGIIEAFFEQVYQSDNELSRRLDIDDQRDYLDFVAMSEQLCMEVAKFSGAGYHYLGNLYNAERWSTEERDDKEVRNKAAEMGYLPALIVKINQSESLSEAKKYYKQMVGSKGWFANIFGGNTHHRSEGMQALVEAIAEVELYFYKQANEERDDYAEAQKFLLKQAAVIERYISESPLQGNWILADVYDYLGYMAFRADELDEAEQWHLKERELRGSSYRLGLLYFYNDEYFEGKEEVALAILKEAYYGLTTAAAEEIAVYYRNLSEEKDDEAYLQYKKWVKRGAEYRIPWCCHEYATLLYREHLESDGDMTEALLYLERGAQLNYPASLRNLANTYWDGYLGEVKVGEPNKARSRELFERGVEAGDMSCMHYLGRMYEEGDIDGKPNYEEAFKCFLQASEEEPASCSALGRYYSRGLVVERDLAKSEEYYLKAVEQGEAFAMVQLGLMVMEGIVSGGNKRAFELFSQAADEGYPDGLFYKGRLLWLGFDGVPQDPEEGAKLLLQAYEAAPEDESNYCLVAEVLRSNVLGEPQTDKALELLQSGADKGDANCIYELGNAYYHGAGVVEDNKRAIELYTKAAEMGHTMSNFALGEIYFYGLADVEENNKKAVEHYKVAGENGHAKALSRIGDYYLYDYDDLNEVERAFEYYVKADQLNYISEGLGLCYANGIGVEKSLSKAYEVYDRGAADGNVNCSFRKARALDEGEGVKANPQEALEIYQSLAEMGFSAGQLHFGLCLLNGKNIAADPEKGVEWISKAAEAGLAQAEYELGNCYIAGLGVSESEEMAMEWYARAAEHGHSGAAQLLGQA